MIIKARLIIKAFVKCFPRFPVFLGFGETPSYRYLMFHPWPLKTSWSVLIRKKVRL
jgi:hypothetical protein